MSNPAISSGLPSAQQPYPSNADSNEQKDSGPNPRVKQIALDWVNHCANCHRRAWDLSAPQEHSSSTCPGIEWEKRAIESKHERLRQLKAAMHEINQKCKQELSLYDAQRELAFHLMQAYDQILQQQSIPLDQAIQTGKELLQALQDEYRFSQNGVEGAQATMNYFAAVLEDCPNNRQYQENYKQVCQTYTKALAEMGTRGRTIESVHKELEALENAQTLGTPFQRITKFNFTPQNRSY
jgi:uncharacterized protein with von Willebrand factor type A (vWA) domain